MTNTALAWFRAKAQLRIFSIGAAIACLFAVSLPLVASPDLDKIYLDAEQSYLKGDTAGALRNLTKYFGQNPTTQRSYPKAHNLKGLIFFQQKNLLAAQQEFEAAVKIAEKLLQPTDPTLHLARYNYANVLYQSGHGKEAIETLHSTDPETLDADTRTRFFHLYGNVSLVREDYLMATIYYLRAAGLAKEPARGEIYALKAFDASGRIYMADAKTDVSSLEKTASDLPSGSDASFAAQLILARGYLYLGNSDKAESTLRDFLAQAPATHPLRVKASALLDKMQKLGAVDGDTIGLLLPLSGNFARYGRLCMNAAFMALGVYEDMPDRTKAHPLKFAVRDSGETPESAQDAVEKLILEDHAIAVVGPLLSKQFPLVAQKAQELGTPLLSLSQRVDAEKKLGSYIFPVALTPNQQIEMIVNHAFEKLNFKRFAILAPSDTFGDQYVQLFWDAVESRGGTITAVERYEAKSTDFREEIQRLLGLQYLDARSIENEELQRRADIYAKTLKVHGRLRERLLQSFAPKPIIDFDAVFIPDGPQTLGQIAPSFAVKGVENLPLLGINTWNTNEIIQRAGRYLQRALFVDAYFSGTKDPAGIQFQNDFFKYFGAQPGTLEVQTYDAVSILKGVLEGEPTPINTHVKLWERLLSKGHFQGISGDFVFSDSGVKRSAHLLTVQGNSIQEISIDE